MNYKLLVLLSCLLIGCAEQQLRQPSGHLFAQFHGDVGKKSTIQGILQHDFDGRPYLETPKGHIWLEGIHIDIEQDGKIIEAKGIIQKHRDLPIVTNPLVHGIPLPDGATVEEAEVRFSLNKVSYRMIDKKPSNKRDPDDAK